jgi:N-acetylglucosaminyldiphosphoundecaprenol N-acetyl-beta-D-mannosaminyltransferase
MERVKLLMSRYKDQFNLNGLVIDNITKEEAVKAIEEFLDLGERGKKVFFVNAACVNTAYTDQEYLSVTRTADLVLADGIGLKIAGYLLRTPLKDNANGTDLSPMLFKMAEKEGYSVFLLGAKPEVVEETYKKLRSRYPLLRIAGYHHGFFPREEDKQIASIIARAKPDLLFVAMGVPLQEKWITENALATGAKVCLGVGGLFDFISERIPRAPKWMRHMGLEWVYRLIQEPRRLWRRYIPGNMIFLLRILILVVKKQLRIGSGSGKQRNPTNLMSR